MKRQHRLPYLVTDNVQQLQLATGVRDEDWVQKFLLDHHQVLPVAEVESAFGPLIPVCRELGTPAGLIDLVFVNQAGLLTLVECKLWKNPEARREVVGQILDYAKEISRWDYPTLQQAIGLALGANHRSLYKIVAENADADELDEAEFVDNVTRNLRRGRFLLLIVGDGIRENVEHIAEFLQQYAHLNFAFALVELGIFRLPDSMGDGFFVQPRLIAHTVEITRSVVRIEDGAIVAAPETPKVTETHRRAKITEQIFFENVKLDRPSIEQLRSFFERAEALGLYIEPGKNSLKLKWTLPGFNFGIFNTDGTFYNCGIVSASDELRHPEIGERYLERLAGFIKNAYVYRSKNRFWWTVKNKPHNRYLTISELLTVQEDWLNLIQETLDQAAQVTET